MTNFFIGLLIAWITLAALIAFAIRDHPTDWRNSWKAGTAIPFLCFAALLLFIASIPHRFLIGCWDGLVAAYRHLNARRES